MCAQLIRLQTRPVLIEFSYECLIWSSVLQILLLRLSFLGARGFFWLFLIIVCLRLLGLRLRKNDIWKGENMKKYGSKHSKMFNTWTCLAMFIAHLCCLGLSVAVSLGETCWSSEVLYVSGKPFTTSSRRFCACVSDCNDSWNRWKDFSVTWQICGEVAGIGRICFNNRDFFFYVTSIVFLIYVF